MRVSLCLLVCVMTVGCGSQAKPVATEPAPAAGPVVVTPPATAVDVSDRAKWPIVDRVIAVGSKEKPVFLEIHENLAAADLKYTGKRIRLVMGQPKFDKIDNAYVLLSSSVVLKLRNDQQGIAAKINATGTVIVNGAYFKGEPTTAAPGGIVYLNDGVIETTNAVFDDKLKKYVAP
jgi:hypothetical protein